MKDCSLVIGWRSDNGPRETVFRWCIDWWARHFPDLEVVVRDSDQDGPHHRGQARNIAASLATRNFLIIADADSVVDPAVLAKAVALLRKAPQQWVLPYEWYFNLTEEYTSKVLKSGSNGDSLLHFDVEFDHRIPSKVSPHAVSGVYVIPREGFVTARGYDERFDGWGYEDTAQALKYDTLWGPSQRLSGNCYHLWHPVPDGTTFDSPTIEKNRELWRRYEKAYQDPNRMLSILED